MSRGAQKLALANQAVGHLQCLMYMTRKQEGFVVIAVGLVERTKGLMFGNWTDILKKHKYYWYFLVLFSWERMSPFYKQTSHYCILKIKVWLGKVT